MHNGILFWKRLISFDFTCWFGTLRALCGCFGAGLTSLLIGPVRPVRAKIMDLLEGTAVQARSIEQSPQSCWHHCRQDSAGHQVALT